MRKILFLLILNVVVIPLGVQAQEKDTKEPSASTVNASSFKSFKEAYAAGNEGLKKNHTQEAVEAYAAAENLAMSAKSKSQAANAAGWALIKAREWAEAKVVLTRAVQEDPDSKIALKNLGYCSFYLYEYGFEGIETLREAIKNLEASGENQELLDRAKGALSREESNAQATPEPDLDLTGKNFKALLALGDSVQEKGQYDLALKIFKQAADVAVSAKSKGSAANHEGLALLAARRPHESVAYFEEAVKDQPKDKLFLNNLAYSYWTYYDSGKGKEESLKKAVEAYYQVNALDPSFHNDMLKMALDELREVDPEAAKAYSAKDDSAPGAEKTPDPKEGDDNGDTK